MNKLSSCCVKKALYFKILNLLFLTIIFLQKTFLFKNGLNVHPLNKIFKTFEKKENSAKFGRGEMLFY